MYVCMYKLYKKLARLSMEVKKMMTGTTVHVYVQYEIYCTFVTYNLMI